MRMSATIKGLDEVLAKLDAVDDVHKTQALRDGLAAGGAEVIDAAKNIVPVDTGDLRDSLHVGGYTSLTPGYRKVRRFGELDKPKGSGKGVQVFIGSMWPYAHLVEGGTRRVAARPYMRRALDTHEKNVLRQVDKSVQKVIDEG